MDGIEQGFLILPDCIVEFEVTSEMVCYADLKPEFRVFSGSIHLLL